MGDNVSVTLSESSISEYMLDSSSDRVNIQAQIKINSLSRLC